MKTIALFITLFISFQSNAQWVKIGGPSLGSILSLAVDGTKVYAGTYGGGIFRSTDNGNTWTEANNGITSLFTVSISISGSQIYAVAGNEVYLSEDEAISWTLVNNGLPPFIFETSIALNNKVFVGLHYGVYVSVDNGNFWSVFNNGLTNLDAQHFAAIGSKLIVGTRNGGLFITEMDSCSWTPLNGGFPTYITALEVKNNIIYAGAAGDGIYISTDTGATWRHTNNLNGIANGSIFSIASNNSTVYAGTLDGCYSTTDTGHTWQEISSGLTNRFVNAFAVNSNTLFAGTQGSGVFNSSDNVVMWNSSNINVTGSFSEGILKAGNSIYNYGEGGIYRSSNSGITWTDMNDNIVLTYAPNINVYSMASDGVYLYAGLQLDGAIRSADSGLTWTPINNGLDLISDVYDIKCSGSYVYANTSFGFFVSSDHGDTWTSTDFKLFENMTVSGNKIFGGSSAGIELSTDNGLTWNFITNGLPSSFASTDLYSDENTIYTATNQGLYMSSDTGNTWSLLNNPSSSHQFICVYGKGPNILASSINRGEITFSSDNGITWTTFNTGLPNTYITSFIIDGTNAFAGTRGSGVYLNSNLINYIKDEIKSELSLQVIPNPSTGDFTVISNSINDHSRLEIINMDGRIIYSEKIKSDANGIEHLKINVSNGAYIVKISDSKTGLTGKTVINILNTEK
jgi:photosystem II stability/assembly factor-like uncharacterized protein